MTHLKLSTEMKEIKLDESGKSVDPRPENKIEHRCRMIAMLAQELASFESIEKMGPEVIRAIGRRIVGMIEDIRRMEAGD